MSQVPDERELAALMRALPAAPPEWIAAACAVPSAAGRAEAAPPTAQPDREGAAATKPDASP